MRPAAVRGDGVLGDRGSGARGRIAVGGAGLAASLFELGLVDEIRPFVNPVVVGGGKPFLPPVAQRIDLELLETRTFGSRVVYSRYARR